MAGAATTLNGGTEFMLCLIGVNHREKFGFQKLGLVRRLYIGLNLTAEHKRSRRTERGKSGVKQRAAVGVTAKEQATWRQAVAQIRQYLAARISVKINQHIAAEYNFKRRHGAEEFCLEQIAMRPGDASANRVPHPPQPRSRRLKMMLPPQGILPAKSGIRINRRPRPVQRRLAQVASTHLKLSRLQTRVGKRHHATEARAPDQTHRER